MNRYLLSFEFEGRNFFGSQSQPDKRTVQDELNKAIRTLTKENTKIIMAGRLDKGVNAMCHTAHFDSEYQIDMPYGFKFLNSLNAILPYDISVFKIEPKNTDFHAQKSAKFRHYRYTIRNSFVKPVFNKNVLFIRKPLNVELMNASIKNLIGEHDFSAFKSVSDNPSSVCNIYYANVTKRNINKDIEGYFIEIDIIGNRFLYNMVRAIVGTLLMIEKDGCAPLKMKEILDSKNRALAGHNVEPYGLTLVKTGYEDPYEYIRYIQTK